MGTPSPYFTFSAGAAAPSAKAGSAAPKAIPAAAADSTKERRDDASADRTNEDRAACENGALDQ